MWGTCLHGPNLNEVEARFAPVGAFNIEEDYFPGGRRGNGYWGWRVYELKPARGFLWWRKPQGWVKVKGPYKAYIKAYAYVVNRVKA